MKRVAILDLGTNVFNLLIIEPIGTNYKILINHKIPVKLGEGRINEGEIISAAYQRGIDAVAKHFETIGEYDVSIIKAFGTSAFRTARNGQQFLDDLIRLKNLPVEIISGDREAELIYLGVRQTLNFKHEKFVILDIGGGSNELIIADMQQIFWKKSYNLGVARLLERFRPSDPILPTEIEAIKKYLFEEMGDLFTQLQQSNIEILVGTSGSSEIFENMIPCQAVRSGCMPQQASNSISIEQYNLLFDKLIISSAEERKKMKGLEPIRVEMIVLACIFVKFILENHRFKQVIQSNFALKEGAIIELLNGIN